MASIQTPILHQSIVLLPFSSFLQPYQSPMIITVRQTYVGTFNCFSYEVINTRAYIYNPCHYHHLPCLTLYVNPIIIIIIHHFLTTCRQVKPLKCSLSSHKVEPPKRTYLSTLNNETKLIFLSLIKILTKLSTLH